MKNKRGITLIALIITIIILLILAGVSLNAIVGENGILTQAQKASKNTNYASEKEAIEFVVSDVKTDLLVDGKSDKQIGEKLMNKEIGTDWKTIVVDGEIYGTNWYFIEKGTELKDYGKIKSNWVVNYEMGKVIGLEEDKYNIFSSTDTSIQSAKKNLIFNLDGTMIDGANNMDELKWSEGSEPVGFDDINEDSGLTKSSFKFDGKDDYIKIKYDNTVVDDDGLTKKDILAQNGFTFEFYGKLNSWDSENNPKIVDGVYRTGLFCFCDTNPMTLRDLGIRCFLDKDMEEKFYYTWSASWVVGSMTGDEYLNDYADEKAKHIVKYPLNNNVLQKINNKKEVYLTFTLDVKDEIEIDGISYVKAKLYEDGNLILDTKYCKGAWTDFLNSYRWLNGKEFQVGRVMAGDDNNWVYSNMECYTLRLYNRALDIDEVKESCKTSKNYRYMLENEE